MPKRNGINKPPIRAPTGTPVCLTEKITGARRGGQTRARMCEDAGVDAAASFAAAPSVAAPCRTQESALARDTTTSQ